MDIDVQKEKIKKGRFEGAWYTLLANIYELPREEIEQRDRRAKVKKRNILLAVVSAVALVFAGISIFAWIQMNEAQRLQVAESAADRRQNNREAKLRPKHKKPLAKKIWQTKMPMRPNDKRI